MPSNYGTYTTVGTDDIDDRDRGVRKPLAAALLGVAGILLYISLAPASNSPSAASKEVKSVFENREAQGRVTLDVQRGFGMVGEEGKAVTTAVSRGTPLGDVTLTMLTAETYATIKVGTPGVEMRVMMDTGSSTLIVPGEGCSGCFLRCPTCFYNASSSTSSVRFPCTSMECQRIWDVIDPCTEVALVSEYTPQCVAQIKYADLTTLLFAPVEDVVELGGYSARVVFGSMLKESRGFASPHIDGIFGLAHRQLNFRSAHFRTPFQRIREANSLPDLFGVYIGDPHVPGSGALTVGHVDRGLYKGELHWLDQVNVGSGYYSINTLSLTAGSYSFTSGFGTTVIDTGTTVIALPPSLYKQLRDTLLPRIPGSAPLWGGYCIQDVKIADWPALRFAFVNATGGVTVAAVPPDVYLFSATASSGAVFRCLGIQPSPLESLTILGDAFLGGFYVVLDRGSGRVAIAPAKVGGAVRRGVAVENGAELKPIAVTLLVTLLAALS